MKPSRAEAGAKAPSPTWRRSPPRGPALGLVLLAHALLLLLSPSTQRLSPAPPPPAEPGLLVRLLPATRPSAAPPAAARWLPPAQARPAQRSKDSTPTSTPTTTPAATPAADEPPADTREAQAAPSDVRPAAPAASGSLLDSEGTRRALRQAAREPLLSERAAAASEDPGRKTAQQRLSQSMSQAANGDCLKGEFAGGGMGLLSLPFWALAEARGKCRR